MTALARSFAQMQVADAVRRRLGLVFSDTRIASLDTGLARVALTLGISDASLLADRIDRGDAAVLDAIAAELTVGETYFFRDAVHFDVLRERVLRPAAQSGRRVRLWSAGCATGEEAYSLAIAALEERAQVEVIATDVNERFLARARNGLFGPWSFRGVSRTTQRAWFVEEKGRFRVRPEASACVSFSPFNLVSDTRSHAEFDAVFCRNVLIYFGPAEIAAVARTLAASVVPGGLVFTGPSDPPLEEERLRVESSSRLVYYRRLRAVEPPEVRATAMAWVAPIEPAPPRVLPPQVAIAPAPPEEATVVTADDLLDASTHMAKAHARLDAGDDRGALDALRRALLLDRNLAAAHVLSVGPLRRLGEVEEARRSLERAHAAVASVAANDEHARSGGATVAELRTILHALTNTHRGRRKS